MRREFHLKAVGVPLAVDTVFWGGGTPGLLPPKDLELLAQTVLEGLAAPPQEWSVEFAPASVKAEKIRTLKSLGVNRFSMGVQSFDAQTLESLGRLHSPKQIYAAYDCMRAEGVTNLNLDLMLALPGQTAEALRSDIQKALDLDPEHLSLYCLTFEEDTKLYLKFARGQLKRDPDQEAALYELAWDMLESAGYEHYEIANFSKPGYACQHNLNTWSMYDWLGLGPSAASQYAGVRSQNVASLKLWLENLALGSCPQQELTVLDDNLLAADSLIFGLRMGAGVDLLQLQRRFPSHNFSQYLPLWEQLHANGLLEQNSSRIRLTRKGKLVADSIALKIL